MRTLKFVALSVIALCVAVPAAAQSDICRPLQRELAALDRAGSGGGNARARAQLAQAREQARRNNCSGGLFQRKGKACGAILADISRLQREVAASDRPRGFFSRGFSRQQDIRRERERIRAAMARAGCGTQRNYGGLRTVCVRTCDGYYFPLNFSTGRQRLAADAEKCMAQYAPGEAQLFYYPSQEDPSQAVSLAGERYADQPYAFAYRQTFHPHCAQRLHQGLALLGERVLAASPPPASAPAPASAFDRAVETRLAGDVPIPIARIDASIDPETAANRAGGLVPRRIGAGIGPIADDGPRAVGDPYLFAEANPGPPATVPGYAPPELKDFRAALRASALSRPD